MSTGGNVKPAVAVTIIDPKLEAKIDAVKRDTEEIKAKLDQSRQQEPLRYFPRGYFP